MKINHKKAPSDTDTWVKIINKYMETMKKAGYQKCESFISYRQLLQTRLNHPNILQHVNWLQPIRMRLIGIILIIQEKKDGNILHLTFLKGFEDVWMSASGINL